MTLSRTARILIAALLLAAAAFFWVNFFNQGQLEAPSILGQPAGVVTPLSGSQSGGAAPVTVPDPAGGAAAAADGTTTATLPGDGAPAVTLGELDQQPATDAAVTTEPTTATTTVATPVASDASAPVIVTGGAVVVTRDLVVDDLPFLVTAPPSQSATQATAATSGAERPQASQRSNINPFSPIVVQAPPTVPVQDFVAQNVPAAEPVIEIVTDANGQPVATAGGQTTAGTTATSTVASQPAAVVRAPAPRTVAPATSEVASLPRPIPSGTLPTTPEILRDARSQSTTATPTLPDVGTLAALRVPDENQPLDLNAAEGTVPTDAVVTPELIGPQSAQAAAAGPQAALPLAVGADPLSRFLRDNDVKFTGTVLGPLSVGVFRSSKYTAPVVLTLGQTLPDTDILLTDLRGFEARFSLGDKTQTLALDLRR